MAGLRIMHFQQTRRLLIELNCITDVAKKFGFLSALLGKLEHVRCSEENSCVIRFLVRNRHQYYSVTYSYKPHKLMEAEERVTPPFPSLLKLAKHVAV